MNYILTGLTITLFCLSFAFLGRAIVTTQDSDTNSLKLRLLSTFLWVAFVLGLLAVLLLSFLQNNYEFQLNIGHSLLFIFSFLLGRLFTARIGPRQSLLDFQEGKAPLERLLSECYLPGFDPTPAQQEIIEKNKESLVKAIDLLNAAREAELRGTPFGGGTSGKYTLVLFPSETETCPVCDHTGEMVKYKQLAHAFKIRCSHCKTAYQVYEKESDSGLMPMRVLAFESPDEVGQMPGKYIVTAKNKREAAAACHELGMVFRLLGEYDKAKSYFLNAREEIANLKLKFGQVSKPLSKDLGSITLSLGDAYKLIGEFDKARDYFMLARGLFTEAADETYLKYTDDVLKQFSA